MAIKRTEQPGRLEELQAHRTELLRTFEDARKVGDQKALDRTELLLRQCDLLIEMFEESGGNAAPC